MRRKYISILFSVSLLLGAAACRDVVETPVAAPTEAPPTLSETESTNREEVPPVEPGPVDQADFPTGPTPTYDDSPESVVEPPPERPRESLAPQRVEFTAEDGTALVGSFWPAMVSEAPAVVLVHMLGGSRTDWEANGFALLLQCAAITDFCTQSYNVLTVDLRGHGESAGTRERAAYPMDVAAALAFVRSIDGVNANQVALVGASIGADSVVAACGEGCTGVVSLSPGGFTGTPYPDALTLLGDKPVLCVAARNDGPSPGACQSGADQGLSDYTLYLYEGSAHGTQMFSITDQDPPLRVLLLEWLDGHLS